MKSTSHKTWQTSLLFLELHQIKNLKKSGGTSHIMSPPPENVGDTSPVSPTKLRSWIYLGSLLFICVNKMFQQCDSAVQILSFKEFASRPQSNCFLNGCLNVGNSYFYNNLFSCTANLIVLYLCFATTSYEWGTKKFCSVPSCKDGTLSAGWKSNFWTIEAR